MNAEKVYASEGSRWYDQNGQSVETVIGKNGNERKPTLREARTMNLVPSVTSVLGIMAKPELENWKMTQVALMSARSQASEFESDLEYAQAIVSRAKDEMAKARDTGSDVHGQIDRMLIEKLELGYLDDGYPYSAYTEAARNALIDLGVWAQPFEVETPFCKNGVAGKVDLKGGNWIVDWKTTNRPLDDGKMPDYDTYLIQLAAYSFGLFGKAVSCANVFLSTTTTEYAIRKWKEDELDWGWQMFCACRSLWMIKNQYHYFP